MLLSTYLTRTRQLLQNPGAPTSLYSDSDLTTFINMARSQIAGEHGCVNTIATASLTQGTPTLNMSSITFSSSTGIGSVLAINQIWLSFGNINGFRLESRSWPYFSLYSYLSDPDTNFGQPNMYSDYGNGVNSVIYFSPIPDQPYSINLDVTCQTIDLVTDATVDAIPYPWSDCVPFLAAFYALLAAQSAARQADANRMYERYQVFAKRAQFMSDSNILREQFEREPEPTMFNQLGISPRQQQEQG